MAIAGVQVVRLQLDSGARSHRQASANVTSRAPGSDSQSRCGCPPPGPGYCRAQPPWGPARTVSQVTCITRVLPKVLPRLAPRRARRLDYCKGVGRSALSSAVASAQAGPIYPLMPPPPNRYTAKSLLPWSICPTLAASKTKILGYDPAPTTEITSSNGS